MKYLFIRDWKTWEPWDRIQADTQRYKDYVQTIRHLPPPDLQKLCDFSPGWSGAHLSLNDSQLSSIRMSPAAQTVTLVLNGEYTDKNDRQVGLRRFVPNYTGVADFQINAVSENAHNPGPETEEQAEASLSYLSGSIVFDDQGWDEIELLWDNLIEHWMLFASGTETAIRFRGFTLENADTPHEAGSVS